MSIGVALALFALFVLGLGAALLQGQTISATTGATNRWPLQVGLSVIPFLAAVALFLVGFRGYLDAAVAPGDAVEVSASVDNAQWAFTYPNGETVNELRVPVGRPVHVAVHSAEAVQRLDVPSLQVGAEARPDADGSLWFTMAHPGESPVLGGDVPAELTTKVSAIESAAFDDFLEGGASLPPAEYGSKLYVRSQCKTCHSIDGTPGVAPSFKGLFGKSETLADGASVKVDEAYVRESILKPTAKVVRGFQPVMPVFEGQLNDKQLDALIAFIKSVPR